MAADSITFAGDGQARTRRELRRRGRKRRLSGVEIRSSKTPQVEFSLRRRLLSCQRPLLAPLVVLLLLLWSPSLINGQRQANVASSATDAGLLAKSLLQNEGSINLKSIVDHQEALARECSQLHEQELLKLKQVIKFNEQQGLERQLASPLLVKVPAICLFVFSEFGQPKSMAPEGRLVDSNKLDLVNWIFDEDELKRTTLGATAAKASATEIKAPLVNNTGSGGNGGSRDERRKRQTQDNEQDQMANGAAKNSNNNNNNNNINNNINNDNLLAGFLFNIEAARAKANEGLVYEEEESLERLKLHDQIEIMLADKRFQELVRLNRAEIGAYLSPVVLVPGLLGSRLQARTFKKKTKRVNIFCNQKQTDWQDMWLSVRQLLPLVVDCWLDNVRLEFDPQTGLSKAPTGVESRVPDFGSVESVRHLDLNQPQLTSYYAPIIERYQQLGYTADKNLLAAPFDFRLAPKELEAAGFYAQLKQLIERAQDKESTSGKPVTLVCHSMGCTNLVIFLRQQTAAWRQKRIRKLIALSSPWAGATKALKALVVGDQLNLPLVSEAKMRKLARTYPSIAFLLPLEEVFARPNMNHDAPGGPVMLETPGRAYRVADIKLLLRTLNLTNQVNWYEESAQKLIKPLEPLPDVQVDCIHSLNVPTPETLVFRNQSDFPNGPYELVQGEGDGTVNFESLMVCEHWARQLPDKVSHTIIMNTDHVGVLGHKTTLTHISDDILFH